MITDLEQLDAEYGRRMRGLLARAGADHWAGHPELAPKVTRLMAWHRQEACRLLGRDPDTGELTTEARRARRQAEAAEAAPDDGEEVITMATATKRRPAKAKGGDLTRVQRDKAIAADRRKGMDRDELAKAYGLSRNTIGRILWEQGAGKARKAKRVS
jgi:hypothetical protein